MRRREFLKICSAAAITSATSSPSLAGIGTFAGSESQPFFSTRNARWQGTYDRALAVLAANVQVLPRYSGPVLIEGAEYPGIWQECGPHESLVYRQFRPDVARNTHMTFFALQKPDGQLPANNKRSEAGFGQIQMVVPIAATALELAMATRDSELLERSYAACSRWDAWLMSFRNTRRTGLIEGFCTYDTGHDNSPRWQGIPPQCPDKDAKKFPLIPSLPRLCPDLSATVFGARVALSAMAHQLGRPTEADRWSESAEAIRRLILEKLFVQDDAAFYDLDAENRFVRVRSDVLSRVCGEHVVDRKTFDDLWQRQLHNPRAFWAPFPLPSIALDDSSFVRTIPRNSWGGPSQALTALRAGRWFSHYGRSAPEPGARARAPSDSILRRARECSRHHEVRKAQHRQIRPTAYAFAAQPPWLRLAPRLCSRSRRPDTCQAGMGRLRDDRATLVARSRVLRDNARQPQRGRGRRCLYPASPRPAPR